MQTTTQDMAILETLINSENVDIQAVETFLTRLQEEKIKEVQNKEKESIRTIQDVRARLDRLSAIFRDINFTLLWKDRVCKTLGRDADYLRWELYHHRSKNMVGKYTASFYEAVSFNQEYLKVAIDTIIALEKERGLKCVVYKSHSLTREQEKEFCIADIVGMTNIEFTDWFSMRLDDFALMFGVKKYSAHTLCDKSAESYFTGALRSSNAEYDKRIYGERFYKCGYEFCGSADAEKIYNCEKVSSCYRIPREIIREYMVVVARQCLVV